LKHSKQGGVDLGGHRGSREGCPKVWILSHKVSTRPMSGKTEAVLPLKEASRI